MRIVTYSVGALLLVIGISLSVVNLTAPDDLVFPHDPVFNVSIDAFFWIIAALVLLASLACLFDVQAARPMYLVAWLSTNFIVYQIGARWEGCHGLVGYLGGFERAFGVSASIADVAANLALGYLTISSFGSLLWLAWRKKAQKDLIKISCPACGGHIKFAVQNMGKQIGCPHCQTTITLHGAKNLKTSCFFCKGHIEFPSHALGRKTSCPHCRMEITLLQQTNFKT